LKGGGGCEREKPNSQAQETLLYNHNASEGNVIVMQLGNVNGTELVGMGCPKVQ